MILKELQLINFKNHRDADFTFSPEINILSGRNGTGKTNVLDAIYYLSFCKSYFNTIDQQNINHDEDFFVIDGHYENEGKLMQLTCGVKTQQKKQFKKDKKLYEKLADHIGVIPAVIISPYDADLINDGSSVRRKFIDGIIAQFDRVYLDQLLQYQKAITQRNILLRLFWKNRSFDELELDTWNQKLIEHGQPIFQRRAEFMDKFIPYFNRMYKKISGSREEVYVSYHSQLENQDFSELLDSRIDEDRRRQYTTVGIHRDELEFLIDGHPIKKFGSQGQQKSFLIALKLAQFQYIKERKGFPPLLLLDDVFDKIDEERVKHLMQLVTDHVFGQIFITDTQRDRVNRNFEGIDAQIMNFEIGEKAYSI